MKRERHISLTILEGTWCDDLYLDEYAYQNPDTGRRSANRCLLTRGELLPSSPPPTSGTTSITYTSRHYRKTIGRYLPLAALRTHSLDQEALKSIVEDMTDVDYRQEILAEFVPGVGAVFTVRPEDFIEAGDPAAT